MAKKGKKGKKKDDAEEAAPVAQAAPPPKIKADVVNYVTLSMNLMNWRFMNFTMRVPTETHLFTVKKAITERHGRARSGAGSVSRPPRAFVVVLIKCGGPSLDARRGGAVEAFRVERPRKTGRLPAGEGPRALAAANLGAGGMGVLGGGWEH